MDESSGRKSRSQLAGGGFRRCRRESEFWGNEVLKAAIFDIDGTLIDSVDLHALRAAMPHLVQILLPVYDNAGQRFPTDHYNEVRVKLTKKFGGLTAYTRAPAEGLWEIGSTVERDDIVAVEIMVESLERTWWKAYRRELEHLFHQDKIVVRAQRYEPL